MPGADRAIEETVDFATALVCAEAVGAMKFACDTTLEYLKARKQFGVPIGTFQALQHRMVDMVISYEQARSMACLAARESIRRSMPLSARARSLPRRSRSPTARATSARKRCSCTAAWDERGAEAEPQLPAADRGGAAVGDADHHLARFASL